LASTFIDPEFLHILGQTMGVGNFVQKTAFLMPFCIGVVAIAFILWYARVRNPIKRLRPPFGLLLLGGIVLLLLNGGISAFIAKAILTGDDVAKSLAEEKKRGYDAGNSTLPQRQKDDGEKPMSTWDRLKYGDRNQENEGPSGD
jgi:hypothetical protein